MSYRVRLLLTHLATAAGVGGTVWVLGQSPTQTQFLVLVGILPLCLLLPAMAAAWWYLNGIRRLSIQVERADSLANFVTGLPELDQVVQNLGAKSSARHEAWKGVERLLEQIAPNSVEQGAASKVSMDGRMLLQVLAKLSRAIGAEVGRILTHANSIAQRSHDSEVDTAEQSQRLNQAVQFVENLSNSVEKILTLAEHANSSVTHAKESAWQGDENLRKLKDGMLRIRAYVESGERKVLSLGERSQEISSIVETMGILSTRTDMLALNASIEAVRAGEEGRGFAIVAEEVRKLAEHTSKASREIADVVESIQLETQDTITTMGEERAQVQAEVARVEEVSSALQEIWQSSASSSEQIGKISEITLSQLQGMQEMILGMQKVSELVDEMHHRSTGIRQTTSDVVTVTRDLEQWISPLFHCDTEIRRSDFTMATDSVSRETLDRRKHKLEANLVLKSQGVER